MWKIMLVVDGLRNKRLLRVVKSYEKALKYAISLHETTGKNYTVERV